MKYIKTIDQAIAIIRKEYLCVDRDCDIEKNCDKCDLMMPSKEPILEAYSMAIKALEQEPILDKIKAEIEETNMNLTYKENSIYKASWGLRKALEIIDKYKAESEGRNDT